MRGVRVRQSSPSRLIRYGAIPRCSSAHSQCTRDARSHTRRIMQNSRNNATRARQYVTRTGPDRCRGANIGKGVQFRSDGLIDALKRSPVDLFGTRSLSLPSRCALARKSVDEHERFATRIFHGRVESLVSSNASRRGPATLHGDPGTPVEDRKGDSDEPPVRISYGSHSRRLIMVVRRADDRSRTKTTSGRVKTRDGKDPRRSRDSIAHRSNARRELSSESFGHVTRQFHAIRENFSRPIERHSLSRWRDRK